jgi:predicted SnoaL-like aldol condensation-catalyzing enzyme
MPSSDILEENKRLVSELFKIIFGGSVEAIDGIDALVAEDYVQHNPRAEQGREGLRRFLHLIVKNPEFDPAGTQDVTFVAEGDMVVRKEMRTEGMLVDIFRVQDGKLQEHWDAFRFAPGARVVPGF